MDSFILYFVKLHEKNQDLMDNSSFFLPIIHLFCKFISHFNKFKDMENKPINRIKVILAERMISNKKLAQMLGKDPATISKWVTNSSQPSLENLIEIAKCLKCEITELIRPEAIA